MKNTIINPFTGRKRSHNFKDLVGKKFSRLTVLELAVPKAFKCKQVGTYWKCLCDCGQLTNVRAASLQLGDIRSCGCLLQEAIRRRGDKSNNWRGGRTKSPDGYVYLTRPIFPGHENYRRIQIAEHIVVMARHLDRPLKKGETIHHKNGIRDDNRIENLELWGSNHRPGQRVSDLVIWAKEILNRYCPEALR